MIAESIPEIACEDSEVELVCTIQDAPVQNRGSLISSKTSLRLMKAIVKEKLDNIRLILKDNETLVNNPVATTGLFAGYTMLHFLCGRTGSFDKKLLKILIKEYHADVNVVAEDGTQPIHLACIFGLIDSMRTLLGAGANIEAEIGKEVFSNYTQGDWCSDFGDKMTLITFSILYDKSEMAELLISHNVNLNIKSHRNKTLLMYAVEKNDNDIVRCIVEYYKDDLDYQNACDDDGFSVIHYTLHPNNYGNFRYDGYQLFLDEYKCENLFQYCIPDLNATVNGNPDTLLYNIAAYRSSPAILRAILPYCENIPESKALYFATLPFENSEESFRLDPDENEQDQWALLHEHRRECLDLILQDLVNRVTFGFPVPEEEKKLMDKLIETDKDVREIVHSYKQQYIHGVLKNTVIKYGKKSITYYDFLFRCANSKKLQLLVRDHLFIENFQNMCSEDDNDCFYFNRFCQARIFDACIRIEGLELFKGVRQLRSAIPLPYECILDIFDLLNNEDLSTFYHSFFIN